MLKKLIIFIILIIGLSSQLFAKKEKLYISVASSLYIVSKSLAIEWEKKNNIDLIIVTGPTSLISRQIYNGQNSDLIITANKYWLNWLDNKQLINIKNAEIVAKNSLVFSSGINQCFYIDINSKSFKNDFLEQTSSSMFPIPHPSTVPL
jgi:molybdate transport system substrate-binding protein